ncbi:MAG: tRNA (adenosine(37)-N6)-dimethylallyltransferase MiaA [Actinobacteria bacterium]|nr:tRNA (adenosine(37)-N6)-dimethylallyltransferase MiaA [Actinomycetota bacterium]
MTPAGEAPGRRVVALVGPTAVGKSETAARLAETLGAEIVSCDSMQIYRGLDIGTAKPGPDVRGRVAHHLLDVVDPAHDLTVSEFQARARAAIAEISGRGRLPLLVGGSGLYFRAVVDDLSFPPRSPEVRRRLEAEAARLGPAALHARLAAHDPEAADRIEPGNARRIVRALEVMEITGRPFSRDYTWDRFGGPFSLSVAGLSRDRAELYARIEGRIDEMLRAGLIEEARTLAVGGFGPTARQALGYRQILQVPPETPVAEIRAAIVRATKKFARRQESWFRADPRVRWFDAGAPGLDEDLIAWFRLDTDPPPAL